MSREDFMAFMGILAGVISLLAYIPYISSIIRRQTNPSRTTWWTFFSIELVTLFTYEGLGASNTIFFLIGDLVGCFLIALLSILYGKNEMSFFDKLCFLGAAVSLGLWIIFRGNPSIAFSASFIVGIIAMIPTLKKTYLNPCGENTLAWLLSFVAATMNISAIETWSLVVVSYPFYEFFVNGMIVFLLSRRGKNKFFLRSIPLSLRMDQIKFRT